MKHDEGYLISEKKCEEINEFTQHCVWNKMMPAAAASFYLKIDFKETTY